MDGTRLRDASFTAVCLQHQAGRPGGGGVAAARSCPEARLKAKPEPLPRPSRARKAAGGGHPPACGMEATPARAGQGRARPGARQLAAPAEARGPASPWLGSAPARALGPPSGGASTGAGDGPPPRCRHGREGEPRRAPGLPPSRRRARGGAGLRRQGRAVATRKRDARARPAAREPRGAPLARPCPRRISLWAPGWARRRISCRWTTS